MKNKIVGHKTFSDGKGGFRHEPLYESEARELERRIKQQKEKREQLMPDEKTALRLMTDAFFRLKELGWRDAMYCPKDGTHFDAIEGGSSGIHDCNYQGEWPAGSWWIFAEGDQWSAHPILFRDAKQGGSDGTHR